MKEYRIKIGKIDEKELTLGEKLIINQLELSQRYGATLYGQNLQLKAENEFLKICIDKLKSDKRVLHIGDTFDIDNGFEIKELILSGIYTNEPINDYELHAYEKAVRNKRSRK